MKFFTELMLSGRQENRNSQQESQWEEQATGCAHVKMEEDQTGRKARNLNIMPPHKNVNNLNIV